MSLVLEKPLTFLHRIPLFTTGYGPSPTRRNIRDFGVFELRVKVIKGRFLPTHWLGKLSAESVFQII